MSEKNMSPFFSLIKDFFMIGEDEILIEIQTVPNNRCKECNKEFRNIEELRAHEKNCDICEKCNENREDLEDHRNEIQSKECEKNVECRKESIKQNNESQKEREEYMEPSGFQELEIESHR